MRLFKLNKKNSNNGFSLLLSLIIMSIILTVSFSVFDVFFLNVMVSGSIKDSQSAFYAADSGIECVYYNDVKLNLMPGGPGPNPTSITCNNEIKNLTLPDDTFQLGFGGIGDSCVTVVLDFDNPAPFAKKIEAYGRSRYNGADCDAPFPRRTERGLDVEYD